MHDAPWRNSARLEDALLSQQHRVEMVLEISSRLIQVEASLCAMGGLIIPLLAPICPPSLFSVLLALCHE